MRSKERSGVTAKTENETVPHFETQLRPMRFVPTKQQQQRQQQRQQLFCSTDPPPLPSQIFHGGGVGICTEATVLQSRHLPIWFATLYSPAKDLNSMSSKSTSTSVTIHTYNDKKRKWDNLLQKYLRNYTLFWLH